MASNQVDGLAETYSLFGILPDAARDQVGVEMAIIGREVLAAQKRDVAKDTGALEGKLGLELKLDELRVRVGLLGLKAGSKTAIRRAQQARLGAPRNYGDFFYGIIVEKGRKAQTVLVERRRRVDGRLRLSQRRKVAADIEATYSIKVKAKAPRPFVHVDRPEIRAEQRIADFWSKVLNRAEGRA